MFGWFRWRLCFFEVCLILPSLKLTACPWKWMVGRLVSFRYGFLAGAMLVSGSVGVLFVCGLFTTIFDNQCFSLFLPSVVLTQIQTLADLLHSFPGPWKLMTPQHSIHVPYPGSMFHPTVPKLCFGWFHKDNQGQHVDLPFTHWSADGCWLGLQSPQWFWQLVPRRREGTRLYIYIHSLKLTVRPWK